MTATPTAAIWLNHPHFNRYTFGVVMAKLGYATNTWLFLQGDDDEVTDFRLVDAAATKPSHETVYKAIDKDLRERQIGRIRSHTRFLLKESAALLSEQVREGLTHAQLCYVQQVRLNAIKWHINPKPPISWTHTGQTEMYRITGLVPELDLVLIGERDKAVIQQEVTNEAYAAALAAQAA